MNATVAVEVAAAAALVERILSEVESNFSSWFVQAKKRMHLVLTQEMDSCANSIDHPRVYSQLSLEILKLHQLQLWAD